MTAATAVRERGVIDLELIRYRREGARLAAMIVLAEPHRIGDETIYDFLKRIESVKREQIETWLRRAGINPLRPGNDLKSHQRRLLAGILVQYSKGSGA